MLEENNKGDFIQQEQDQFLEKSVEFVMDTFALLIPLQNVAILVSKLINLVQIQKNGFIESKYLVCFILLNILNYFYHQLIYILIYSKIKCIEIVCKICIHDYISKNQNTKNKRKCPSCKGELEIHLSKSIRKDPYKQQMVDFLYPQFAKQEQLIVKRVKELFPLIDLEFLLDEFNYENLNQQQYQRKKKHSDSPKPNLKMVVDTYLNIPFDKFVQDLYEESSFQKMKQILLEKYPDYYKKQAETSKLDQEDNNSSSYDDDSVDKQKDPLQLNTKRKSSVQHEQQIQKKQQTNKSPSPSTTLAQQQTGQNGVKLKQFPFKTSAPTQRAQEVFLSNQNRHSYISEKTLKSIQEYDDTLYKFYVNPLTNLEHEYVGLQNILRLQKRSNPNELTLKQVKSFFVKTIKAHTQQKNKEIPSISTSNINLYFCEQLLCDINTPLKDIFEQTNENQYFILDYEIVLDNVEFNS